MFLTGYVRTPSFCASSANESLVLESMLLTGEIWLLKVLKVVVDGGVYWFVNDAVWVVGP